MDTNESEWMLAAVLAPVFRSSLLSQELSSGCGNVGQLRRLWGKDRYSYINRCTLIGMC